MDTILESIDLIQESEIDTMFAVIDSMNDYAQKACAIQEQYTDEAFESLDIFTESFYMEEAATKTEEPKKSKIGQFIEKIKEAIKKFFKKIVEFFSKNSKKEEVDTKNLESKDAKTAFSDIFKNQKVKEFVESDLGKKIGIGVGAVGGAVLLTAGGIKFGPKIKGKVADMKEKHEQKKGGKLTKINKDDLEDYEVEIFVGDNGKMMVKGDLFSLEILYRIFNVANVSKDKVITLKLNTFAEFEEFINNSGIMLCFSGMTKANRTDDNFKKSKYGESTVETFMNDLKNTGITWSRFKECIELVTNKDTITNVHKLINDLLTALDKNLNEISQKEPINENSQAITKLNNLKTIINSNITTMTYNYDACLKSVINMFEKTKKLIKHANLNIFTYHKMLKYPDMPIEAKKVNENGSLKKYTTTKNTGPYIKQEKQKKKNNDPGEGDGNGE